MPGAHRQGISTRSETGPEARIDSATYLGSRMEYAVRSGNTTLLVSRPIDEPRFAPGDPVGIAVDPAGITRLD
ncbi:TOBE domain-containing protein [Saliniramus fredricksonii]|uniref:TOBE domain-containing protein n=1 Tax=Saliniramus fredricksonii TaxID=1653334 RepID=UPI000943F720|nr:TOBE domain-containing protein [Saliniramus fredricksonii]